MPEICPLAAMCPTTTALKSCNQVCGHEGERRIGRNAAGYDAQQRCDQSDVRQVVHVTPPSAPTSAWLGKACKTWLDRRPAAVVWVRAAVHWAEEGFSKNPRNCSPGFLFAWADDDSGYSSSFDLRLSMQEPGDGFLRKATKNLSASEGLGFLVFGVYRV